MSQTAQETLRAEWTKLRTLPGTGWLLLAAAALTIAVGAAVDAASTCGSVGCQADPAKLSLTGVQVGQAIVAIIAVLAISNEYSTGMIRVTLTAMPRRCSVLGAKAALVGGLALLTGALAVLGSVLAGRLILPGRGFTAAHGLPPLSLGYGPDLRAAAGSVLYLALIALLALGVATAVRDSAVSIGLILGLLYLFPIVSSVVGNQHWQRHLEQIGPMNAGLYVQATVGLKILPLTPWQGLGVLAAWAFGALLLGGLLLRLRDALRVCRAVPGRRRRRRHRKQRDKRFAPGGPQRQNRASSRPAVPKGLRPPRTSGHAAASACRATPRVRRMAGCPARCPGTSHVERKGPITHMDAPVLPHIPALIAAHMRAAACRRPGGRTGPFLIGLDAHSDDPMRNYAVPDHGADPGAGDADALIAYFRDRHRTPRLEYIEEDAPLVWPALAAAGFTIERRTPVMTATPTTRLTPRSPVGITFRQADGDADLAAAAAVQHQAYQIPHPPGPHDIARLTRLTRRGGLVAIAVDESSGMVTGTGLIDVASDRPTAGELAGVGELAAVGVLDSFRRLGIASALSAHLARTAHSQGISLVFLEAEPEEEQIYRRSGFTDATTKIWASIR